MAYRDGSHTVCHSASHCVWVTTYRSKVLTGAVALPVRALVRQTCAIFAITIHPGVVRKEPGHLLVSAPPHMAPREIMRRRTGRRSRKLCEECPRRKKRSWGRHCWARGSLCATVGQRTAEMNKEYLAHHGEPHPSDNLRTEDAQRVLDPAPDFQSI